MGLEAAAYLCEEGVVRPWLHRHLLHRVGAVHRQRRRTHLLRAPWLHLQAKLQIHPQNFTAFGVEEHTWRLAVRNMLQKDINDALQKGWVEGVGVVQWSWQWSMH